GGGEPRAMDYTTGKETCRRRIGERHDVRASSVAEREWKRLFVIRSTPGSGGTPRTCGEVLRLPRRDFSNGQSCGSESQAVPFWWPWRPACATAFVHSISYPALAAMSSLSCGLSSSRRCREDCRTHHCQHIGPIRARSSGTGTC